MCRGQHHDLAHFCTLSDIIWVYLVWKLQHKGPKTTCTSQNQVLAMTPAESHHLHFKRLQKSMRHVTKTEACCWTLLHSILIIPVFICFQKYAYNLYKPKPDSSGQRLLWIEQQKFSVTENRKNICRGQHHVHTHCCTLSNIIGVYLIRKLQHKGHQKNVHKPKPGPSNDTCWETSPLKTPTKIHETCEQGKSMLTNITTQYLDYISTQLFPKGCVQVKTRL